jgi:hypothetical protein
MVFVAWKLSTIEEWSRDQNSLFQQEDYRNKGHNTDYSLKLYNGTRLQVDIKEEHKINRSHNFNRCFQFSVEVFFTVVINKAQG